MFQDFHSAAKNARLGAIQTSQSKACVSRFHSAAKNARLGAEEILSVPASPVANCRLGQHEEMRVLSSCRKPAALHFEEQDGLLAVAQKGIFD